MCKGEKNVIIERFTALIEYRKVPFHKETFP